MSLMDDLQNISIGFSYQRILNLEERIARLEKLVKELMAKIEKLSPEEDKNITKLVEEIAPIKKKKEEKYKLSDHVVFLEDVLVDGKIIDAGTKGIIDNRLSSSNGIYYIIKIDDSEMMVKVTEDLFNKTTD